MDAMRGFDPSSSMFQTRATNNLSHIGFGAVRSQKDIKQQDDDAKQHNEVHDNVQLTGQADDTPTADELTKNAAQGGALGEVLDDYNDDDDAIGENYFGDDEDAQQIHNGSHALELEGEDVDIEDLNRLNQMDDDAAAAREILNDVPSRSLEPAKNIVANQLQDARPAEALTNLQPVEGVNHIDFTRSESMGILDIHDTNNKPIAADMEDNFDAGQKQNMAENYINNAISALPEDRRAIVSEMKTAVENWAGANGLDPKAAFAEKLRDLAAGWDDESLQNVAQTYVDAGREMSTSAAD